MGRRGSGVGGARGVSGAKEADHGMSMRQGGVIIGKVGEAVTEGRRDRGLRDLMRRWRGWLGSEGLDNGKQGRESGSEKGAVRGALGLAGSGRARCMEGAGSYDCA